MKANLYYVMHDKDYNWFRNYVIKLDVINVAQLVDKTDFNNTIEQLIETMIRNRKYFKNLDEEIRRYVLPFLTCH